MHKNIVTLILLFAFNKGFTQTSKAVFAELGGIGLPYSFSFDTRLKPNTNSGIGIRAGLGGFALEDEKMLTVPVQLNWLLGTGRNFFEVGVGATFVHYDGYSYGSDYVCDATGCFPTGKRYAGDFVLPISTVNSIMGTMSFGYRRQPAGAGFTWKAALTPLFNDNGFWPLFAGIGVGYKF